MAQADQAPSTTPPPIDIEQLAAELARNATFRQPTTMPRRAFLARSFAVAAMSAAPIAAGAAAAFPAAAVPHPDAELLALLPAFESADAELAECYDECDEAEARARDALDAEQQPPGAKPSYDGIDESKWKLDADGRWVTKSWREADRMDAAHNARKKEIDCAAGVDQANERFRHADAAVREIVAAVIAIQAMTIAGLKVKATMVEDGNGIAESLVDDLLMMAA